MTVPSRLSLVIAVGLCVLPPAVAGAEEPLSGKPSQLQIEPSANQRVAESIATRLRESGLLKQFDVDVSFRDGVAELTGSVRDAAQREQAVQLAREVAGVRSVVDRLSVAGAIVPVQAGAPPAALQPIPPAAAAPAPVPGAAPAVPGVASPEAMPIFQAPAPAPHALNPPRMPPYAWPTYAPYNNYSRVAIPLAYPCNAWPFIGPAYPFPKVPLGWRSVKLQYDDCFWFYSKTATKRDWWVLRFY